MKKTHCFIIGLICLLAFSMIIHSDMRVYAQTDVEDFVDNNSSNVDSSVPPDLGSHTNFTAETDYGVSVDTLKEELIETPPIEDFVDNNVSNVDGISDVGTHSNFTNMKATDGIYDTLTESGGGGIVYENSYESYSAIGQSSYSPSYSLQQGSGNNRLVVVTVSWEDDQAASVQSCTFNSVGMTKIADVSSVSGYYTYVSLWYLLDSSLPSSSGSYTIAITASQSIAREIYVGVAEYSGVEQSAPDDYDTHFNNAAGNTQITLTAATDNSLVVAGAAEGGTNALTNTNNLAVLQEQILTSSGSAMGHNLGINSGDITVGWNNLATREAMVGAVWQPAITDYHLDLEVQFTNVTDFLANETLCIYAGSFDTSEDIGVYEWDGSQWQFLGNLTASSWNNFTVSYLTPLTSTNYTIKFQGWSETGDSEQSSWQIDATLLRLEDSGHSEIVVQNQDSDVDGTMDAGEIIDFNNMTDYDSNMAVLTETQTIDFIGYFGANAESGTGMIISKPTGTQDGDFMFAIVASTVAGGNNGSTMASAPSGWIEENDYVIDTGTGQHIYIYWKFAGASEPSSYSWTWATSCGWAGQIITLRGVDSNSPIHVEGTTASGTDQNPNTPSITTTEDNCFVISLYCADGDVAVTGNPPSGTTEIGLDERASPGNGLAIGSAYYTQTTAGSTGAKTWTGALGAAEEWIGEQYAFLPATDISYTLDQEVQWTDIPLNLPNANLSIYTGSTDAENILVDVWNGTGWENLFDDLTANSWNNISITDYLISSTFTIRFRDGTPSLDSSTQDTWEIDVALIHVWNEETVYKLDLEVQWTNADFDQDNEELCIKTGTFSGTEDIIVDVWDGSQWQEVFSDLSENAWNNVSVSSYLISNTFTIRYRGGSETSDNIQDSWQIDAALLHTWPAISWGANQFLNETLAAGSVHIDVEAAYPTGVSTVWYRIYNVTAGEYVPGHDNISLSSPTYETDISITNWHPSEALWYYVECFVNDTLGNEKSTSSLLSDPYRYFRVLGIDVSTPTVSYIGATAQEINITGVIATCSNSSHGELTEAISHTYTVYTSGGSPTGVAGVLIWSAIDSEWQALDVGVSSLSEGNYYVRCYFQDADADGISASSNTFSIVHVITVSPPTVDYIGDTTQEINITGVIATCTYDAHGVLDDEEATNHTYRVYASGGSPTSVTGDLSWTGSEWQLLDVDVSSLPEGDYYVTCYFKDTDAETTSAFSNTFSIVHVITVSPPTVDYIGDTTQEINITGVIATCTYDAHDVVDEEEAIANIFTVYTSVGVDTGVAGVLIWTGSEWQAHDVDVSSLSGGSYYVRCYIADADADGISAISNIFAIGHTIAVSTPTVSYIGGPTTHEINITGVVATCSYSAHGTLGGGEATSHTYTVYDEGGISQLTGDLAWTGSTWQALNVNVTDLLQGNYYVRCYFADADAEGTSAPSNTFTKSVFEITVSTPSVVYIGSTTQELNITGVTATCSNSSHGVLDGIEATVYEYTIYTSVGQQTGLSGDLSWTGSEWQALDVDVSSLPEGDYYVRCPFQDSDASGISPQSAFFTVAHTITVSEPSVSYDSESQTITIFDVTANCSYSVHGELDNNEATVRTYTVYTSGGVDTGIAGVLTWTGSEWQAVDVDVSSLSEASYYVRCYFADADAEGTSIASTTFAKIGGGDGGGDGGGGGGGGGGTSDGGGGSSGGGGSGTSLSNLILNFLDNFYGAKPGQTVTVSGTISSNENGIPITITLEGETYTTYTFNNGSFTVTLTAPNTYGSYTVTAKFAGDSNWKSSSTTCQLLVVEELTQMTLNIDGNLDIGEQITIQVVLTTENGDPIRGGRVTISLYERKNSVTTSSFSGTSSVGIFSVDTRNWNLMDTFVITTDENGRAVIELTVPTENDMQIVADYAGKIEGEGGENLGPSTASYIEGEPTQLFFMSTERMYVLIGIAAIVALLSVVVVRKTHLLSPRKDAAAKLVFSPNIIDPTQYDIKAIFLLVLDPVIGPMAKECRIFDFHVDFLEAILDPAKLTNFYTMSVTRAQFKLDEPNESVFVTAVTATTLDEDVDMTIQGGMMAPNLLLIVAKKECDEQLISRLSKMFLIEWPDEQGYLIHQMDKFISKNMIEMNNLSTL
ncbi:MAG: hypothetical protein ACFFCD_07450 [Promethearchaeota archaeon]